MNSFGNITFNERFFVFIFCLFISCTINPSKNLVDIPGGKGIAIAHLADGINEELSVIQSAFAKRNPGYALDYIAHSKVISAQNEDRVIFVQTGGGTATLNSDQSSKFSMGDIILLHKGTSLTTDSVFSSLIFTVPHNIPAELPTFIRPDWDENITDTPGGCATETNAYRRILLTWEEKVGPYLFHSINAHRVRIMDSFSHYHPVDGGFDEFYLVQMARPKARIITSNKVDLIENHMEITRSQAKALLQSTPLKKGDLVYLPRGVVHRGVDSVLAQVITIPGFIPGAEIGVDHHLRWINERLGLSGMNSVSYNVEASAKAIVK